MSSVNKKRQGDGVRAPHSKTKTGCRTCKARRVKCDEGKPICKRCQTFGVVCDGYDLVPSTKKTRLHNPRPLVPLAKMANQSASDARERSHSAVYKQPASQRFESESEARYFNCFQKEIAKYLGGCFDPDLWPSSFLRASEVTWPIRKGLIALGALDLTSKEGLSQIREGPKKDNITDNYVFALQEYTRFIRGIKQVVNPQDIRTQLLASILIICFESYLGYPKMVEFQVRTCVRLLEQWKQKNFKSWVHPLKSPAPDTVEDQLIHLFDRLDLEVISRGSGLSRDEHLARKEKEVESIASMPLEFSSLGEARMYGNLLHCRTVHLLNAYDDKASTELSVWNRVAGVATPAILAELRIHERDFQLWGKAFDPMFKRSLTPEGASNFRVMGMMRAHWLVLMIMLQCIFQKDELWYDYFHNEFVEMLALTKALLANEESNFTLSAHSIVVLDLVAKKCRDSKMRREAIRLLAERPRREAFWDSVMAANICAWVVEIEEEGMVNGFIPEEARTRKLGAKFHRQRKEAELWCYQLNDRGDLIRRETTITWGTPSGSMPCYAGTETVESGAPMDFPFQLIGGSRLTGPSLSQESAGTETLTSATSPSQYKPVGATPLGPTLGYDTVAIAQ